MMRISVVVCTYNRCESLRRTLKSFREIVAPQLGSWELILVDNNSNDGTRIVAEAFKEESGLNIKYVLETRQGLSYARNRGIQQAKGEVIAFTDDDVIVDKYWLLSIQRAFEEYDASCVGGKILPIWEISKPKWLTPQLHYIVAVLDRGDKPFYLDSPMIWGANFAVKACSFEKFGAFDTKLGKVPGRLFAGEDTHLVRELLDRGEKILYYPNAVVYHCIGKERISKGYFRRWKYDQGVLRASLLQNSEHNKYLGIPCGPASYILEKTILLCKELRDFPGNRFAYELGAVSFIGFILQRISGNRLWSKS